ncbi:MAG: diacylglycerol kinase family protein, partial [Dehalococcoidales bacterium]|nr:diacylglycerol kinase family protein [Dehalococcoidales bacterium]
MTKALLIYNPHAGQVVVRHELEAVVAFLEHNDWVVTLQETTKPKEATELTQLAVERGAEVVIAAGGDGTVSEVASGLIDTPAVLGVLPLGTTNSWAIQMGIPALNPLLPSTNLAKLVADIEERTEIQVPVNYYRKVLLDAAKVLVEKNIVSVDMGDVSGRKFLMWAGIGLDAAILESVPPKEKAALGSWAYWITALGVMGKRCSTDVRFRLDGVTTVINTPLIVV